MAAASSKILVIGGTGYIGKFVVEASAKTGHPTFLLVRESTLSNPEKAQIIDKFKTLGVNLISGDLYDHESLVKAIKQVDVVISTVGYAQLADQDKIISAIKEAGNVKRFLPSEFGNDVDRTTAVDPAKSAFATKSKIRRTVEAEGIPYTYVSSNFFAGYFLPNLSQPGATSPPRDKVVILGDGNAKSVWNKEEDIAAYTIKAVDDPRTLNKILYIRPPANTLSFNELVSLWENKIGKTLEKVYVPEEQVLKQIQESAPPLNVVLSITHAVYVKGDQTNFEIEESFGVEASQLYPDVKYTTVDEYLSHISSRFASCRKSYMTMFGILVMHDLTAASQGSSEPEAKWFDLFSSRYRKVVSVGAALFLLQQFATSMEDLEPYDCSNTPYGLVAQNSKSTGYGSRGQCRWWSTGYILRSIYDLACLEDEVDFLAAQSEQDRLKRNNVKFWHVFRSKEIKLAFLVGGGLLVKKFTNVSETIMYDLREESLRGLEERRIAKDLGFKLYCFCIFLPFLVLEFELEIYFVLEY
ncbi:hypothetical protein Ahy_A07g035517 isoform B [Arachis hypogaea]|uniref:NmrA-like domain-containing protein n=1 Tax=Arachis hypogaea TaxID=3818 RepID=A0A445CE16_ARAHY|nr:hypothetical protein Ahy_A07g035517 isoform B [Arachis hypogaea]